MAKVTVNVADTFTNEEMTFLDTLLNDCAVHERYMDLLLSVQTKLKRALSGGIPALSRVISSYALEGNTNIAVSKDGLPEGSFPRYNFLKCPKSLRTADVLSYFYDPGTALQEISYDDAIPVFIGSRGRSLKLSFYPRGVSSANANPTNVHLSPLELEAVVAFLKFHSNLEEGKFCGGYLQEKKTSQLEGQVL